MGVAEVSEVKGEVEAALAASVKHEHSHEQLHACIGVSLVLGFVFMLLVDQIGSSHVHNTEGESCSTQTPPSILFPQKDHVLLSCSTFLTKCDVHIVVSSGLDPESARASSSKITTTLGLVVHAAADGVALGAAASTSQTSVQLIVFVAIMLHKVEIINSYQTLYFNMQQQLVVFDDSCSALWSAGPGSVRSRIVPDACWA